MATSTSDDGVRNRASLTTARRIAEVSRRAAPIAFACAVASVATLIANGAVARGLVSDSTAGIVAFCAAWGGLFPLVRRRGRAACRAHGLRGTVILAALWLSLLAIG